MKEGLNEMLKNNPEIRRAFEKALWEVTKEWRKRKEAEMNN